MARLTPHDNHVLKEIQSGKYRNHFLIYNRKSTDDTANQKNSIKYQRSENTRFAYRQCLPIAPVTVQGFSTNGIISERHSGFKEDLELAFGRDNTVRYRVERPKFHRLVELLSKGYFKGVIFLCWDRASRNKGDDTILRKLMKSGVDVRFALAQYDKTSAGELHMDIDGMFSEHHSRITREKVSLTMRNNRAQGICTYRAPVGYLNTGDMRHKPLDPARAPLIKRLFELAATGDWSLVDLARWSASQGLTMPPVRRRRTEEEILAEEEDDVRLEIEPIARLPGFTSIHKILSNPFYVGKVYGNDGALVQSVSHAPLITEALYNKVQQQLLRKKTVVRYAHPLEHPLRRMVRCGACGRVYTPYEQKGVTYYGARCESTCQNPKKSLPFHFIAEKVAKLMEGLCFSDAELLEIETRASTDIALFEAKRISKLEDAERRKRKLREDLAYLHANRLSLLRTGAFSAEALVAEESRLNSELDALCQEEQVSDASMRETVSDVVRLSELLKNGAEYYRSANPAEKDQIIRTVFSELTVSGNSLSYKCRKGFQALASRFVPLGDPTGWISELMTHRWELAASIEELALVLNRKAHT